MPKTLNGSPGPMVDVGSLPPRHIGEEEYLLASLSRSEGREVLIALDLQEENSKSYIQLHLKKASER